MSKRKCQKAKNYSFNDLVGILEVQQETISKQIKSIDENFAYMKEYIKKYNLDNQEEITNAIVSILQRIDSYNIK